MINADVAMVMGSNAAENHPIAMRWLRRAREEYGAYVISCDPRYTRTSSFADLYVPFRSGTDVAFVGGIINYAQIILDAHSGCLYTVFAPFHDMNAPCDTAPQPGMEYPVAQMI